MAPEHLLESRPTLSLTGRLHGGHGQSLCSFSRAGTLVPLRCLWLTSHQVTGAHSSVAKDRAAAPIVPWARPHHPGLWLVQISGRPQKTHFSNTAAGSCSTPGQQRGEGELALVGTC